MIIVQEVGWQAAYNILGLVTQESKPGVRKLGGVTRVTHLMSCACPHGSHLNPWPHRLTCRKSRNAWGPEEEAGVQVRTYSSRRVDPTTPSQK